MKRKRSLIDLLILAEVLVLVLLAIAIAVSIFAGEDTNSSVQADYDTTDSGQEENRIESESDDASEDAGSDTEAETTDTTQTSASSSSSIYDTIRLSFSDEVEVLLDSLTTEQLAAMLFVTTPEELTGVDTVNAAGDSTRSALSDYPVSGLVYASANFLGTEQTTTMLTNTTSYYQELMGLDILLIIEELGGEDASPAATALGLEVQDSPSALAETGSTSAVSSAASERAAYLSQLGFTTILGPVADAADGSSDAFDALTYGDTALNAADYVAADVSGITSAGLNCILQAFPGVHTAADDYSAYQAAIDAGVSLIQVSSTAASSLTSDEDLPAMFSAAVTEKIRDEMGFSGVLMTADLSESGYDISEAVVLAMRAGMNLLYTTDDFASAYQAVLDALESGEITNTMLMNAAGRILTLKLAM